MAVVNAAGTAAGLGGGCPVLAPVSGVVDKTGSIFIDARGLQGAHRSAELRVKTQRIGGSGMRKTCG